MKTIRIATFNVENLFTRFNFAGFQTAKDRGYLPDVVNFLHDFDEQNPESFNRFRELVGTATIVETDEKRQHTALALSDADADLLCLQEIDNIRALQRFVEFYLHKTTERRYHQTILHEGNDIRGIDIGAVVDEDLVVYSRSHAHMRVGQIANLDELREIYPAIKDISRPGNDRGKRVFARDCLELEVRVRSTGFTFSVFICHFKSMSGGRKETIGKRQIEALAVRQIISERYPAPAEANWMVVGDLNDYRDVIKVGSKPDDGVFPETIKPYGGGRGGQSGVDPLFENGFSYNVVSSLPALEQWTHYFGGERTKSQIDYILVSPNLKTRIVGTPTIVRSGQAYRVPNTSSITRYPRIGWDRPKASDHCPVVVELDVSQSVA